ncbi:MAG TPA: NifU family protein [Acidimicrobiales bacterium]|nr:NifU family protein [Acidimicrobiales bacterium]
MARTAEELAVVTLTPEARGVVREALAQEPDPDRLALWLEVRGVQDAQFVYDLYFQAASDADDGDASFEDGELTVVVPKSSVDRLRGARLEWNAEGEGGLVLVNPNSPEPEELGVPAEVMAAGLDGPIGSRVSSVLDQMVNPSIAAHGGRADLVAMDESGGVAYLRLSGGCQGCAMSRMTLTQGIEAALREEVPEITRVVDVTDHSGGANPYY